MPTWNSTNALKCGLKGRSPSPRFETALDRIADSPAVPSQQFDSLNGMTV